MRSRTQTRTYVYSRPASTLPSFSFRLFFLLTWISLRAISNCSQTDLSDGIKLQAHTGRPRPHPGSSRALSFSRCRFFFLCLKDVPSTRTKIRALLGEELPRDSFEHSHPTADRPTDKPPASTPRKEERSADLQRAGERDRERNLILLYLLIKTGPSTLHVKVYTCTYMYAHLDTRRLYVRDVL